MSSLAKKYSKNIINKNLRFAPDMYNNVLGSLVITHYMLAKMRGEILDDAAIRKKWKALTKKPQIDFWLDDKDFIPKALGLFGMKPEYGKFAMCTSAVNILFLPYIDGTVLPVREDGIYPNTALNGKINPIEEKVEEGE